MAARYAGQVKLSGIAWDRVEASLWESGYAQLPPVLTAAECAALVALYPRRELFRSRIEMARYRFGVGDYQYFDYPLPELVRELRERSYPPLAAVANRWMEALGDATRYPAALSEFTAQCRAAGQRHATPLLLHYEAGGYNCLHQDLYGDLAFPLQLVCFLSEPGADYTGGDFLLVEQRPRAQSLGRAIHARRGEALVFPTRHRPVKAQRGASPAPPYSQRTPQTQAARGAPFCARSSEGARRFYRANVKHGVSPLLSGTRFTLGIIYHDAR